MNSILQLDSVRFSREERLLFDSLSLAFPEGGFIVVSGPSGSGKSTLLRLLCRLEEPQAGELRYQGRPYAQWDATRLRREVSYLQQTPALARGGVRHNLLLPFGFAANRDMEQPDDDFLASLLKEFLLDGVALSDPADKLSLGQQQRLCLIRALLLRPRVLLLDEPVSALDPESRELVEAKAEDLSLSGMTVIMVSHQSFVPRRVTPLWLTVRDGRATFTTSGEG